MGTSNIIKIVMAIAIAVLCFLLYRSISEPIYFEAEKQVHEEAVIKRLKDIRDAELAYKAVYNKFADNFDTLIAFVKTGQFPVVTKIGTAPDTLTEEKALEMGLISRDTSYVAVKDSLFPGSYPVDSLSFIPMTSGARFKLQAGTIERGRVTVAVFMCEDTQPFDKKRVLKVGSMTEPTNAGNWE
jgi:hypothetical protein